MSYTSHICLQPEVRPIVHSNLFPFADAENRCLPNLRTHALPNSRPADTGIREGHGFGDDVIACYDVVGCGACVSSYVVQARYAGGAWNAAVKK